MTYQEILKKVSQEMDIPLDVVKRAYESYWVFIREQISNLPLKSDLSEEEFSRLRTNFNIPSLGKLSCTYERLLKVKKSFQIIKQKIECKKKLREDSQKKENN